MVISLTHRGIEILANVVHMESLVERRLRVVFDKTDASDDFIKYYFDMVTWSTVAAEATVAVGSFATSLYSHFAGKF